VSRLVAERRCGAPRCPQVGDKRKSLAHPRNDVNDPERRSPAMTNGHLHVVKTWVSQKVYCTNPLRGRESADREVLDFSYRFLFRGRWEIHRESLVMDPTIPGNGPGKHGRQSVATRRGP
jgi:hypothetical protein